MGMVYNAGRVHWEWCALGVVNVEGVHWGCTVGVVYIGADAQRKWCAVGWCILGVVYKGFVCIRADVHSGCCTSKPWGVAGLSLSTICSGFAAAFVGPGSVWA